MAEIDISAAELSRQLNLNEAVISQYKSGKYEPKQDRLEKFAKLLDVSESWLMGYDVDKSPATEAPEEEDITKKYPGIFRPQMKKVPLLGKVACGEPIYSPNYDDGFALLNSDVAADFALVAKGESMAGVGIHSGDVVFFHEQDMVDNGQIAAVFVDDEVTLKRVYYYREKNKLVLNSENPEFEPLVYLGEELNHIHIIGKAVAQLRKI
ncbi:MAG: helix-turn-helix domain-containing protein [Clostridiales bacterium]|nr:helix-turn-helix domain-containing protein [Clostridiales bacterium]